MTEHAPVTDALTHEAATLEEPSLPTNGTAQDVATKAFTPPENVSSDTALASSEQDITQSQNHPPSESKAVIASSEFIWYRSASIQTLPPSNGEEFKKIHGREPTNQELVSKIGSAAIGRYSPKPSSNPYDVVLGKPFAISTDSKRRSSYTDSSFQTGDAVQCKKALLRAKLKATMLAKRQRDAARTAGFKVWSETRDEYIIHSERFPIDIRFDDQGNATNANIDGFSLPNICGEEIRISKEGKDAASKHILSFTPPPTPQSMPDQHITDETNTPQRIRTVEPCIPSDDSDPVPIEWYGYIEHIPTEAIQTSNGGEIEQERPIGRRSSEQESTMKEQDRSDAVVRKGETVMMIGGERFADEYIVYDATALTPPSSVIISDSNSDTKKKRKSDDEWEPEMAASTPKRLKTSPIRNDTLTPEASSHGDSMAQNPGEHVERHDAKDSYTDRTQTSQEQTLHGTGRARSNTLQRVCEEKAGAKHEPSVSNSPRQRGVKRQAEDQCDEERQCHKVARVTENDPPSYVAYTDEQKRSMGFGDGDIQKKDAAKKVLVEKREDDRRVQQAQRVEERERADRQKQAEPEIQRAREARNQRKLEIEAKKRAQEADVQRRRGDKDRDQRRRRDDSHDTSGKSRKPTVKQKMEPSKPMDPYAAARQAESKRRELVFAAREVGEADGRTRERSPARDGGSSRSDVKRPESEKKVQEKRVTKKRPSRTARGELERYDPRKRFGGGK
ncbi:hypothetical protein ACET3X_001898 [Alternaria dauci]|uniref:Uncharacterized protein n=1 Tax=Alternaria dauci TaxID=48095 RepID=A0ABR3UYL8_9PLEO